MEEKFSTKKIQDKKANIIDAIRNIKESTETLKITLLNVAQKIETIEELLNKNENDTKNSNDNS